MSIIAPLMYVGVEDGVFPYGEWALFDKEGIIEEGATSGAPGCWFDLASLTKVCTATAALFVSKESGIGLDSRVENLLGHISGELKERISGITLRSLLTHTSGLPAWYPFYSDGRGFFEIISRLPSVEGMVYSDIGFMLLREILCEVCKAKFEEVIRRYCLEPLGITGLCFHPSKELPLVPSCRDNAVEEGMCSDIGMSFDGFRPHFTDVIGEPNDGNAFYYFKGVSGHAGLFGTAHALVKLGIYYLNTEDEVFLGATVPQSGCEGRCLGFHTGGAFPTGFGHTGFTGTSLWIDRRSGAGLVLLTNRLYFDHLPEADMNGFRRKVHEALLEASGTPFCE